jgi:hypothetical protein
MVKLSAILVTISAALLAGALVQVYYSDLSPKEPWSAPALFSLVAIIFLNWTWLFF